MEEIIQTVAQLGLLNDEQPSLDLFDLDYFRGRIKSLKEAFPETYFNHAMAVKANPIRCIMMEARDNGLGAECASLQEAKHALQLGFEPGKVVYDSPVKTPTELREAVELGLHMNLDNEHEIEVLADFLKTYTKTVPVLGVRINPVVGAGNIAMISTATKQSKFGLPLTLETKERIFSLFRENPWITGLHIHIGSQGVPLDKFVSGTRVLMDFVAELEAVCPGQITTLDIGGGLSTTYTAADEPEEFAYRLYRKQLEEQAPGLFSGKYKVVTEMGRSLFLKAGTSLTRIESIKDWIPEQNPILLTYLGTNQFPREVYLPHIWRHRFSVFTPAGAEKKGDKIMVDIGGPLCFQGDYLGKEVELVNPAAGDILAIHDTGAYTTSMYCRFNSIRASPVYGYSRKSGGGFNLLCYRPRETVEQCLSIWGEAQPTVLQ